MRWLNRDSHVDESCYFCVNHHRGITWRTRYSIDHLMVDSVRAPVAREKKKKGRKNKDGDVPVPAEPDAPAQREDLMMEQGDEQGANIELMDYDDAIGAGTSTETSASIAVVSQAQPDEKSENSGKSEESELGPSPPSDVDTSPTYEPPREELQKMGEPIFFSQIDFDNLAKEIHLSDKDKEILGSRLKMRNLVTEDFRITANRKRRQTREFDELFETDPETQISYCTNIVLLFLRLNCPHNPEEWRLFIDGSSDSLKAVLLHITNKRPSIPLVDKDRIILPPLHIKLGIVRNFTKALHRDGRAYAVLLEAMIKLGVSAAKVQNGEMIRKKTIY